jgi:hypothetical protein
MPDDGFNRFICLYVKRKELEIILGEEFLYGAVVQHTFICDPWSGYSVSHEDSPLTKLIALAEN